MSENAENAFKLFKEAEGKEEATGEWFEVTQDLVNQFADVTRDHQFIHVDPVRAAQTPLGSTIAHGFLTLSLLPGLNDEMAVMPEGMQMAFNYGLDRVRFLQPVPSGSRGTSRKARSRRSARASESA